MPAPGQDVTTLLRLASGGDRQAKNELFRLVEGELRRTAQASLSQERPGHSLQTTVLIDEAFQRLVGGPGRTWEDRAQFYRCAARAMREILVDHARQRAAGKRGGGARPGSLDQVPEPADRKPLDPLTLLALHEALDKLAVTNPEYSQIVELHHFGGWELKQIAEEVLSVSYKTVKRRWRMAKVLLYRELCGDADDA